jgi:hypothetical protein
MDLDVVGTIYNIEYRWLLHKFIIFQHHRLEIYSVIVDETRAATAQNLELARHDGALRHLPRIARIVVYHRNEFKCGCAT